MKRNLLLLLLLACCTNAGAQQYIINAKIDGLEAGTAIYIRDILNQRMADSTISRKEKFTVKGFLQDDPAVFWIQFTQKGIMYYTTIMISQETMNIDASLKDFPHSVYSSGSATDAVHNILKRSTGRYWFERDRVVEELFSPAMQNDSMGLLVQKRKELIARMKMIDKTIDSITIQFLLKHVNSFAGVNQLFYSRSRFSADSLLLLYNKVSPQLQQSTYGQMIATYIKVGKVLKKGDEYFDFASTDADGKNFRLSDIKEKYILLDFATTYCGPCMQSLGELREQQKKYSGKLIIINVNADKSKEVWMKGHERDKPDWPSVWDGKGAAGEAVLKYGATGWPTFVLINPAGKIVAKTAGYGTGTIENLLKENIQ